LGCGWRAVRSGPANTIENFRLVFDREFLQTIIILADANDAIYK